MNGLNPINVVEPGGRARSAQEIADRKAVRAMERSWDNHRMAMVFVRAELGARVKLISEMGTGVAFNKVENYPPTKATIEWALSYAGPNGVVEYTKHMCAAKGQPYKPYMVNQSTQTF